MKIIQSIIASTILFLSCNDRNEQNNLINKDSIKIIDSLSTNQSSKLVINSVELPKNTDLFVKYYYDDIHIDTSIIFKDFSIEINHKPTIINYTLPKEFAQIFDEDSTQKQIQKTTTSITIKLKGVITTSYLINSDSIVKYLDTYENSLKSYGVLLMSKKFEFQNDYLNLHYSFSIPFTDLGKPLKVTLDLRNKNISYSFE